MARRLLKRISADRKVMLRKPVVRGTRITIELILEMLANDTPTEEILKDYPGYDATTCSQPLRTPVRF